MVNDLGWAPTPDMPWNAITEDILFNLATEHGPALDASNISEINVPAWVLAAHAHGVEAFIAIGGAGNDNWGYACNDTNRAQFVQNLVGFATSNGFDGIDLDIEDGPWMAVGPPNPAMTACIIAVSDAGHAVGLIVTADVITNWQGPWYAPSQTYVDRYNLMTYGDNLAQMQQDVADTIDQGLPAPKFVIGIDVDEHSQPPGGCGQFAQYASQAGLMGTFVWDAIADYRAGNACMNGLAGG
jgi:chitinase